MRRLFSEYPIESAAALGGLFVTGIGVALSSQPDWVGIVGTAATIVGTSLAAIAASWSFGRSTADRYLLERLTALRAHLATASGQISGALVAAVSGEEDFSTTIARVDQSVGTLSTIVRDMGNMIGRVLRGESAAILETKRDIADLGHALGTLRSQLEATPTSVEDEKAASFLSAIETAEDRVSALLEALQETEQADQEITKSAELVACPFCDSLTEVEIGDRPGHSALGVCSRCKSRFHAHRGSQGLFARRPGGSMKTGEKSPAEILAVHSMELPDESTRLSYLRAVEEGWKVGDIRAARDLTETVERNFPTVRLSYAIRMPLFWSLIDRHSGTVTVGSDADKDLIEQPIESFHQCDLDTFVFHAHASWLAQAIFRLGRRPYSREQIARTLFGKAELTEEQAELLDRATSYARDAWERADDSGSDGT